MRWNAEPQDEKYKGKKQGGALTAQEIPAAMKTFSHACHAGISVYCSRCKKVPNLLLQGIAHALDDLICNALHEDGMKPTMTLGFGAQAEGTNKQRRRG